MASLKDSLSWLIVSLILATVLGNGAIWQYHANRLNRMKSAAELREREIVIYRDIVSLADAISKIYAEHPIVAEKYPIYIPSEHRIIVPGEIERLRAPLDAQMNLRMSDFFAVERDLASIEGREPRKLPLDFLRPPPPTNLHVTTEKP
jgi:hypothetical protein